MPASPSLHPSASQWLERLRRRDIGAVELLQLHLQRIEAHNARLGLVVQTDPERATAAARAADNASTPTGPLHGLPMTIKDTWEVTGMPTTAGLPLLAQHRPRQDADAVARLRAAGAVLFGKTNVPVAAGDHQSYNPLYGVSRNPWDIARTVGGSSGGAAGALAAGFTPLELGSDIGGSIRVPAHFCGVWGHKPSYGLIPIRGHIPAMPGSLAEVDLVVGGPMARSAADLPLALSVLAGPAEQHAKAWRLALPAARQTRLKDFRVALWTEHLPYAADQRMLDQINAWAADLERLGVQIDREARPPFDAALSHQVYMKTLFAIVGAGMPPTDLQLLVEAGAKAGEDTSAALIAQAVRLSHAEYAALAEQREHLMRAWADFFTHYDVLLCPVHATVAFPHDHSGDEFGPLAQQLRRLQVNGAPIPYHDGLQWPGLATVANLPATSLPTGRMLDGLPVGVQAIGPYLDDLTLLRFATEVENAFGPASFPTL